MEGGYTIHCGQEGLRLYATENSICNAQTGHVIAKQKVVQRLCWNKLLTKLTGEKVTDPEAAIRRSLGVAACKRASECGSIGPTEVQRERPGTGAGAGAEGEAISLAGSLAAALHLRVRGAGGASAVAEGVHSTTLRLEPRLEPVGPSASCRVLVEQLVEQRHVASRAQRSLRVA
ncbi:hypothetical protein NDU88_005417 [Pleurodeles waltl]|uniref:Uncharacterized protein n=1 Tax=Pleurodeles waltl TaxID=8319 RepID=A0AAV7PFB2_PLEWA|nr:hypothetical protein NDU88_005417 [Pleurodeles waltl]